MRRSLHCPERPIDVRDRRRHSRYPAAQLGEFRQIVRHDVRAGGVVHYEILVGRRTKRAGRHEFGRDGSREHVARDQAVQECPRGLPLIFAVAEDDRAILVADVRALAIHLRRIVDLQPSRRSD